VDETRKLIAFDLEGPLSPNDNAYELMGLFPQGEQVFEVISRYDDLLALEGKEGYQPGDTLSLIVPSLLHHAVTESHIRRLAEEASLTPGAQELVARLGSRGWGVFCITTTYQPYARLMAQRLGIAWENVASTPLSLDSLGQLTGQDAAMVEEMEKAIVGLRPGTDDQEIKERLDRFFWSQVPGTALARAIGEVKPVGGERKLEALRHFARAQDQPLEHWAVVGDSITDSRMLEAVEGAGGLAIAFNANEYALPHTTMSLASASLLDLAPVLDAWERGKGAVEELVREKERAGGAGYRGHFHWLSGRTDLGPVVDIHKRIRRLVRAQAAELG
jgi:energy-converting hydrogenase A subunit R